LSRDALDDVKPMRLRIDHGYDREGDPYIG